jgi:hypothetical protein
MGFVLLLLLCTSSLHAQKVFFGEEIEVSPDSGTVVHLADKQITISTFLGREVYYNDKLKVGFAWGRIKKDWGENEDSQIIIFDESGSVLKTYLFTGLFSRNTYEDKLVIPGNGEIIIIDLNDLSEIRFKKTYRQLFYDEDYLAVGKVNVVPLNNEQVELPSFKAIKAEEREIEVLFHEGEISAEEYSNRRNKLREEERQLIYDEKRMQKKLYSHSLLIEYYDLKGIKQSEEEYTIDKKYLVQPFHDSIGLLINEGFVTVGLAVKGSSKQFTGYGKRGSGSIDTYNLDIASAYMIGDKIFTHQWEEDQSHHLTELGAKNHIINFGTEERFGFRNAFIKNDKIYFFGRKEYLVYDIATRNREKFSFNGKNVSSTKKEIL